MKMDRFSCILENVGAPLYDLDPNGLQYDLNNEARRGDENMTDFHQDTLLVTLSMDYSTDYYYCYYYYR